MTNQKQRRQQIAHLRRLRTSLAKACDLAIAINVSEFHADIQDQYEGGDVFLRDLIDDLKERSGLYDALGGRERV